MILKNKSKRMDDFESNSFVTSHQLLSILEKRDEFKDDLQEMFSVIDSNSEIFNVGNAKFLIDALKELDNECEKIDITTQIKNINLRTLLEDEKAIFEILSIKSPFILHKNKSDLLLAETQYQAKTDLLDYYNFSKFANYCHDNEFANLVDYIKEYLKVKNSNNEEVKNIRLLYENNDEKFYIRAITSTDYRDFGINFSAFVAIASLGRYVVDSGNEIYIDNYSVNDSELYISFSFKNRFEVGENLSLSFNLILENDEIKRNAVSFNGVFKLKFDDRDKSSEISIRPKGIKLEDRNHPVDLLTFYHRGNVENIFNNMKELPKLIDYFIKQVSEDAKKISKISNPNDVKDFIKQKVENSRKPEFKQYKNDIIKKLSSINVENTFKLFELLREVEDLFQHDDIISRNFWRTKLYESLIERK